MTEGTSVATPVATAENVRRRKPGVPARPMPADFRVMAMLLSPFRLRTFYGCNARAAARWYAEAGITPAAPARPGPRPAPTDFAEKCATLTQRELRQHYQIGAATVRRWYVESGCRALEAAPPPPRTGAPIPEDFAAIAKEKTRAQLAAHYRAGTSIIDRWLSKAGVRAVPGGRWGMQQAMLPQVDGSVVAQAAQHLRKFRPSVYKAEILPIAEREKYGLTDGKGYYIVAGKGAVPANDLVAMAEAKGFDARAWAKI